MYLQLAYDMSVAHCSSLKESLYSYTCNHMGKIVLRHARISEFLTVEYSNNFGVHGGLGFSLFHVGYIR